MINAISFLITGPGEMRNHHQNKVLSYRAETVQALFYPVPELQPCSSERNWYEVLLDPLRHHSQATQPKLKDCCSSLHLESLLACLSNSGDWTGYGRTLTLQSGCSRARVRHIMCLCFTAFLELNPEHSVHTDHLVTFFLRQISQKFNVTLCNR